ncbi:MAG: urea amidolyase [Gammaproteobacteria bacterium]|nr:urea amidolyase [Gammaproteobacteria bacterium]
MAVLSIDQAGPMCSVQDAGRQGFQRFGVTPAGVMHPQAAALCWQLLGRQNHPLIEVSAPGLMLRCDAPVSVSFVWQGRVEREGVAVANQAGRLSLAAGEGLRLHPSPAQWGYLGIHADYCAEPLMGSYATHARSELKVFDPLSAGASIEIAPWPLDAELTGLKGLAPTSDPIRLLAGPQIARFSEAQIAQFTETDWRIGHRSDRMAYQLEGPPLSLAGNHDIVSDGITFGAIQITGSGQPYVLMADRQPTGGYPKIGCIIAADLGRFSALPPGSQVQFAWVDLAAAQAAAHAEAAELHAAMRVDQPDFRSERLLGLNLVDGVVNAKYN